VRYLGLTLPRVRDLVQGFVAIAFFMLIADLIGKTFGHKDVTQFQLDIYRTARETGWVGLLCVALVVVGPIGEETLFRGFLFGGWYRSPADTWPVIIVTAFLWAVVHVQYDLYLIVQIFIYGLVLGWTRWKSGSTILTMLLHGVVNLGGVIETLLAIRN
jgi:membrane protease YdiL (CAAX protease family)